MYTNAIIKIAQVSTFCPEMHVSKSTTKAFLPCSKRVCCETWSQQIPITYQE